MKAKTWMGGLAAMLGLALAAPVAAEVSELKMMSQYGIGYMQLTLMKHDKLVEKHLAKDGLAATKVTWATMAAGAAANDALLSGGLHFAAGGTGPALILWDRTKGNLNVLGVSALSSMPNLLVTRAPHVCHIARTRSTNTVLVSASGARITLRFS